MTFTAPHYTPQLGYIEVQLPNVFQFNSVSTARAQFQVSEGGTQYASNYDVEGSSTMKIWGLTTKQMPEGKAYTIRIAGL